MASSDGLRCVTIPSSGDLSASIFCFVDVNTSSQLVLPSAGGTVVGVLQNNDCKLAGDPGAVGIIGISQVYLGGTVTPADIVKTDGSGHAVTASAGDIAAGAGIGRCYIGGSSGSVAEILLGAPGIANAVYVGGDETVTSGALSVLVSTSYLSVTGTQAYSLANGKYNGQKKRIEVSVAATAPVGTLTITTPFTSEQATFTFDTVAQQIELEWRAATGWHLTGRRRAGTKTFTVGTNNIGADDMHLNVDLSVTGTVTSSLANPLLPGERIHVTVSTAASTPLGSLTGAYKDKNGTTRTAFGNTTKINATTAYLWIESDGSNWREIISATATFT